MNGQNGHPVNFADTDGAGSSASEYDRRGTAGPKRRSAANRTSPPGGPAAPERSGFTFDIGSLLRPALKRWYWLIFGTALGVLGGIMLGLATWKTYYVATAQLVYYVPPVATDAYRPQPLTGQTLVGMINSGELFKRVGRQMSPPVPGTQVQGLVKAVPERNSEIVTVEATGTDPRGALELVNLYNREVIAFTQEHQRNEALQAEGYVAEQLKAAEDDIEAARKQIPTGASHAMLSGGIDGGPAASSLPLDKITQQLDDARAELAKLLITYLDAHPAVKRQRAHIAALEASLPAPTPTGAGAPTGRASISTLPAVAREEWELAYLKLRTAQSLQGQLINRQRAIEVFKANPPGNFRIMQPATMENVSAKGPGLRVALLAAFFGMLGLALSAIEVLRRELFDNRLKTEGDVSRVTGLPVLATLGDMRQMSLSAREAWAFRTWIALQDRLAYSPNHGLICGVTSSNAGEGRSTWINLLAGAARKCGFRVLTIATRPTVDSPAVPEPAKVQEVEAEPVGASVGGVDGNGRAKVNGMAASRPIDAPPAAGARTSALLTHPNDLANGARPFAGESEFTALTASALFTPAMVTEKLMGPETDPLVHIPLPGWTWNLERRKQWQGALNVWRKIDNVVILVELPPASMPESVLLASNLPNLVWLTESGRSDASETRAQLQTLRHARCNLVGAFINRAMTSAREGRFSRWIGCLALFGLLGLATPNDVSADEVAQAGSGGRPATMSVSSPAQRAQWQQKLTLGPGDILNFSIYGDPELTREEVPVGPDGRVSYLEAQNVMAAGLTVDELREKLNEELGKYRRAPQAFVVPVTYNSKKYFVLGKVSQRGAFPLNRPTTLLEAVARAGGLETGLASDRSMVEMADLSRSFIARNGQRLPVDFQRLFQDGDLSQNVTLEPNDYIYFPSGGEKEVYVLGAVRTPGSYLYHTNTGVIGAIAARGGFSERAWKKKVLVLRGGLGRPETFSLDANDVLSGKTPDLKLQPKDIVFVSDRPWIYAEELLEAAANAFVTSAVVTWTADKVTGER